MFRLALLFALLAPAPALAAPRTFAVGSFERVRVDGPFEVRIATGQSPGAKADGGKALLERLDIAVNGTTLVVRVGTGGWGESGNSRDAAGGAPVVTLTTPRLTGVAVNSGGKVTVGRMTGQRIDLSVSGAGSLAVSAVDTDQLNAILFGTGTLAVGGRAARARLANNGEGTIDAAALTVNDLVAGQEGGGEIRAAARYTAQVTSTGLGRITVLGNAKCTVKASAGGPVTCGKP